jgi:hypothetical protein
VSILAGAGVPRQPRCTRGALQARLESTGPGCEWHVKAADRHVLCPVFEAYTYYRVLVDTSLIDSNDRCGHGSAVQEACRALHRQGWRLLPGELHDRAPHRAGEHHPPILLSVRLSFLGGCFSFCLHVRLHVQYVPLCQCLRSAWLLGAELGAAHPIRSVLPRARLMLRQIPVVRAYASAVAQLAGPERHGGWGSGGAAEEQALSGGGGQHRGGKHSSGTGKPLPDGRQLSRRAASARCRVTDFARYQRTFCRSRALAGPHSG